MTQTIDTNVLVYGTHRTSPFHSRARALLEHLAAGPSLAYVLWPALLGYLRIVTDRRVLSPPLSTDQALTNIERLLAAPHVRTASEGDGFLAELRRTATGAGARGKMMPDAHLVALMHELGITTIWTNDRDFRKFDGITVRNPFDERYANGFD